MIAFPLRDHCSNFEVLESNDFTNHSTEFSNCCQQEHNNPATIGAIRIPPVPEVKTLKASYV